jgi:hypothetical protein
VTDFLMTKEKLSRFNEKVFLKSDVSRLKEYYLRMGSFYVNGDPPPTRVTQIWSSADSS